MINSKWIDVNCSGVSIVNFEQINGDWVAARKFWDVFENTVS